MFSMPMWAMQCPTGAEMHTPLTTSHARQDSFGITSTSPRSTDLPLPGNIDLEARYSHALQPTHASRRERRQLDLVEERSLAGAMLGVCVGWFAFGPVGGLVGLWAGAVVASRIRIEID